MYLHVIYIYMEVPEMGGSPNHPNLESPISGNSHVCMCVYIYGCVMWILICVFIHETVVYWLLSVNLEGAMAIPASVGCSPCIHLNCFIPIPGPTVSWSPLILLGPEPLRS